MGWSAFFFKFRDSIFRDYAGIFRERREVEDGDEDNPETYEEKKREEFNKNWGWYSVISKQAEDDPIKIKAMFELELKFILNHLSYIMTKNN